MKIRLTHVSMVSVLAILAHAEYQFGTDVLALPSKDILGVQVSLALAVPVAIDSYVIRALRAGRDIGWAIALTTLSVAAGTMSHLVVLPLAAKLTAAAVFGAVMAVVLWRVHELEADDTPRTSVPEEVPALPPAVNLPAAATSEAEPAPAPEPRKPRKTAEPSVQLSQVRGRELVAANFAEHGKPKLSELATEHGMSQSWWEARSREVRRPHLAAVAK